MRYLKGILVALLFVLLGMWSALEWKRLGWIRHGRGPRAAQAQEFENSHTGEALLKTLIAGSYPEVGRADVDDWTRVNLLRQWAVETIDWSTRSALLDAPSANRYYSRDAVWIFDGFLADRGGVWCGGAAYALAKLYELYGYEATTYDHGIAGSETHVVTLVRITHDGGKLWIVQDPSFDLTYTDTTGKPLDVRRLIDSLQAQSIEQIRVLHGQAKPRDLLLHPDDAALRPRCLAYVLDAAPVQVLPGGVKKYRARLTLDSVIGDQIRSALKVHGMPADPVFLLALPQGTSPCVLLDPPSADH